MSPPSSSRPPVMHQEVGSEALAVTGQSEGPGPWDKVSWNRVILHCGETPPPRGLLTTKLTLTHSPMHVPCREALPTVPRWLPLGRLGRSRPLSARGRPLNLPCGIHPQPDDGCKTFLEGEACILLTFLASGAEFLGLRLMRWAWLLQEC